MNPDESAETPARSSGIIGRLARRWRQILLVWVLVSAPLAYLLYTTVKPTYEAVSLLRVEPAAPDIYGPALRDTSHPSEVRSYLQTQVQLIESNTVLENALARPGISGLKMVRSWQDPKAELRKDLQVTIVGENTYLIQVALSARDAAEAAAIVNAVVEAYLEQHNRYQQAADRALRKSLENERDKVEKQVQTTRKELAALVARENGRLPAQGGIRQPDPGRDAPVDPSVNVVTREQFREMTSWLLKADFEMMEARARLETARGRDPADRVRELESAAEEVKRKRDSYARYLTRVKVESDSPDDGTLDVALLNQDLQTLKRLDEVLKSKLAQIDFEIGQESYRVSVQDRAGVPLVPSNNRRLKFMAAAPVGALILVLGLFLLVEVGGRRGGGPDPAL